MSDFSTRFNELVRNCGGYPHFSKLTGVPVNTLYGYRRGESEPKVSTLKRICDATQTSPDWLLYGKTFETSNNLLVPKYNLQLSAGSGAFNERAEIVGHTPIDSNDLVKALGRRDVEGLAAFDYDGDSMLPTLQDGGTVMADLKDTRHRNGIFALIRGDEALIKRLQFTFAGLHIISDNKDLYPPEIIPLEQTNDIQLIGRCFWNSGHL